MTAQLAPVPRATFFANDGTPLAYGLLTSFAAGSTTKIPTYVDSTQVVQNLNPLKLDFRGSCALWLDPSLTYKIVLVDQYGNTVPGYPVDNIPGGLGASAISGSLIPNPTNTFTLGNSSFSWANVYIGPNETPVLDPVTGNIGYYARTAAEIAASVTPVEFAYPPGDVRRYGALGNGTTDDSTAVANALLVAGTTGGPTVSLPAGYTFKITSYLQILSNTTINLLGTLQLTNRQSGLYANGATNIGIYGFGTGSITDSTVATQAFATITAISQAAQAVVTINSPTNPFSVGQQVGVSGVFGMTQINGFGGYVQTIGGSSGAWTITLNVNSSAFTAYSSGGVINSGYFWNPGLTNVAPAIHLRSVTHAIVDGVNILYTAQGIQVTNVTANYLTPGQSWSTTQANPVDVQITHCYVTFTEWSGISCYSGQDVLYGENYVYRNGDGGLWIMGGIDCDVVGNHRVSPATVYANTVTYGTNNAAQPTTWNDEQGMEFENCHNLLIANNLVKYFWAEPIDIKQGSNRVLCTANRVFNCEQNGIVVRAGDPGDTNACWKVSIIGNTISSQGYELFNVQTSSAVGAIAVSSCFQAEILDNVIYSYQSPPANSVGTVAAINCTGPGSPNYIGDANHQSHLIIKGNSVDFTALANSTDTTEFDYSASTPTAIQVNGLIDSVHISSNKITADYYGSSDPRANNIPAISVTYNYYSTNTSFYPTNCKVDENTVCNWGGAGINVTAAGITGMTTSGLSVCGNNLGCMGVYFITVNQCNYANISNNVCNQMVASIAPGVNLIGITTNYLNGVNCTNNVISGNWQTSGNGMTYGIAASFVNNCNLSNNTIVNAPSGSINIGTFTGNVILTGSTGFPRSGAASPAGTVGAYYVGEPYLDTAGPTWYWATGNGGATTWAT